MPGRVRLRPHRAQTPGDHRAEHPYPAPDRLVRDIDAALSQQFLDISKAKSEAEIEPHSVLDDLGREPVAGIGKDLHPAASTAGNAHRQWSNLTNPANRCRQSAASLGRDDL